MRRLTQIAALLCLLTIFSAQTQAQPPRTRDAEVSVNKQNNQVEVRLRPSTKDDPSHIEITLYDKKDSSITVELGSIPSEDARYSSYRGSLSGLRDTQQSSMATQNQESYVGFELRIPLSTQKTEVISRNKAPIVKAGGRPVSKGNAGKE